MHIHWLLFCLLCQSITLLPKKNQKKTRYHCVRFSQPVNKSIFLYWFPFPNVCAAGFQAQVPWKRKVHSRNWSNPLLQGSSQDKEGTSYDRATMSVRQALPFGPIKAEHSLCIAKDGLEFLILLPIPPEFWDYRSMPPCLFFSVVINPGALYMLSKYSTNWAVSSAQEHSSERAKDLKMSL